MPLPGFKYVSMYDFCRSQVSLCMTPAGVKDANMCDSYRSLVSNEMTSVRVTYGIIYVY